jgi:hypothetical protein
MLDCQQKLPVLEFIDRKHSADARQSVLIWCIALVACCWLLTLYLLLNTFVAIESDVRKAEMVYIDEEFVVYVKHTQTAAVVLNDIIDDDDIPEDHGTTKTSSPNTSIFSSSLLPPSVRK